MKLLNFQSQNLVVDYISFNIQGSNNPKPIAKYLFEKFNFNSTIAKGFDGREKSLFYDNRNQHQVSFRQYVYDPESKSYWVGTKINFSRKHAVYFYSFIKKHQFDWNLFELKNTSLGRIDLHYFRKSKITDQNDQVEHFMEKCCQRIRAKSKRRKAKWGRESNGLILKIGSRSSSNYYRVYQKSNGLEFELELKNELVKSFQKLLVDNCIKEFEHDLSKYFYRQSFKSLNLNTCYMDWLLDWYRKASEKQNITGLLTTYLKNENLNSSKNKELTFNLLRFLSFIKSQKSSKRSLDDQVYYITNFLVSDFTRYIGVDDKSHYQRKKVLQILQDLQIFKLQTFKTTLENFDDGEFCSSVMIPYFKVKKKGKVWTVTVAVGKQLLSYEYPYHFTNYFTSWKDKYQCQVKFQILQTISTYHLEKQLPVEDFLKPFNVSNKKQTEIKELILEALNKLINSQLIQPQFKIIKKDGSVSVIQNTKLTLRLITQSRVIYLEEIVHYKDLFNKFEAG